MIGSVSRFLRRALLLAAVVASAWAIVVALTGGVGGKGWWFSSREPMRPLAVSAIAALWYVIRHRQHGEEDLAALARLTSPRLVVTLAAISAFVVGVRWGTFVAGGQDSSGYVRQAEMWTRGDLGLTAPAWVVGAPWRDPTSSSAPLGYLGIEGTRRIVPLYPPGFPLMMAAFQALGGRSAVFYVVPLLGAVAVWATYLVGASLGGRGAGAMAGALLVASPAFLRQVVQPMSDVPATALWTLAVFAACRPSVTAALGAGVAASLALVTRPNLAPLAGVVILLVLVTTSEPSSRVRRTLACASPVAVAAAFICLLNWYWYGSPLTSGYGSPGDLYAVDRVWPNLKRYGAWLLETQTPFPLLGLGSVWLVRGVTGRRRTQVALVTMALPLAVLAHYLPYFVFDDWWYLRFLLPAYPLLLCGASAVILTALGARPGRRLLAALVGVYVTITLVTHGVAFAHGQPTFNLREFELRFVGAAQYADRLPRPAVLVAMQHTGSLGYYTGHDVLRWDVIGPGGLDGAVAYLRGLGYRVYLVVDPHETIDLQRTQGTTTTLRGLERLTPVRLFGGVVVYALAGSEPLPRAAPGG